MDRIGSPLERQRRSELCFPLGAIYCSASPRRSDGLRVKLVDLLSELWQIGREGTFVGAIRFVRLKRLIARKRRTRTPRPSASAGVGIVGAGNYVSSIHLPCLKALGAPLYAIASRSGDSARALARLYGIGVVYQSVEEIVKDKRCEALLIATPHNLHPQHILLALGAALYTYCEKPAAIDSLGIELLEREALAHPGAPKVMIGFNRRFSPAVQQLRQIPWVRERTQPVELHYRVNFGPKVDNAMSDPAIGGGRIHGACCHYVDLIAFLVGVPVVCVTAMAIRQSGRLDDDTFSATMTFADGSIGSLLFTSEGNRAFDHKEEIILSCGGRVARIVNYAELRIDGRRYRFRRRRYGAMAAMRAFLTAKNSGSAVPVTLADGVAATRLTLAIQLSLREGGQPVELNAGRPHGSRSLG